MEVRIDHSQKWLDNHWRTIQSAYGKAPFFEYYAQDLHDILFKNHKYLFDLDLHLLSLCLKWLKWKKSIKQNKIYEKDPVSTVNDLRNVINAKNSTESMFSFKGIEYRQVFGHTFVADLSIIDLVFCTGPDAGEWIRKAALSGEQIDKK